MGAKVTVPAREQLTVFVNGEGELPGLIFFGLSPVECTAATSAVVPRDAWPYSLEPIPLPYHGETWQVVGWYLPILVWPQGAAFRQAVHGTMQSLVDAGARVAWTGAEGVPFYDPPGLLDPKYMTGGALAWLTDDGRFGCPIDPDLPWAAATDEEMLLLRAHAGSLASSG